MQVFTRVALCGMLAWLLGAAVLLSGAIVQAEDAREADKQKLAPLQAFVGEWRGTGQRERGKTAGSWLEKTRWWWKFGEQSAQLAFKSEDAKYLATGALAPGEENAVYQLTITAPDGKTSVVYRGKLDEDKLVLEASEAADELPARISLRLVAEGKRMVALYEAKSPTSDRYFRLAEVGYTRVGSGFGQGSQGPECIVTGGEASIAVSYEGKTYYVCCTGCKDYFDEDPKRAVEEYLARKAEEKAQAK
jgi:YHS domain-containing protein